MGSTSSKRDSKGRWPKGVSGHPGGAPAVGLRAIRRQLAAATADGATLTKALLQLVGSADERVAFAAIKLGLAYLGGPPAVGITREGRLVDPDGEGVDELADEDLEVGLLEAGYVKDPERAKVQLQLVKDEPEEGG